MYLAWLSTFITDNNENLKKRLGANQDKTFMFKLLHYLMVSVKSNKIYVSDAGQDTVACLKSDGTVIFQYKGPELRHLCGLCVDDEANVIVCCRLLNCLVYLVQILYTYRL